MTLSGGDGWLTFDPGRPISPCDRMNEERGDAEVILTEGNSNVPVSKYTGDLFEDQ